MRNCTVPPLLFQESVRTKLLPKLQRDLHAAQSDLMAAAADFTGTRRDCEQYVEAIEMLKAAAAFMRTAPSGPRET